MPHSWWDHHVRKYFSTDVFAQARVSVGSGRMVPMTATQDLRSSTSSPLVEDLDASGILAAAGERKATEDRAAADLLDLAAAWADLHPPESLHSAASFTARGCEHEEPIAGAGCPAVAEFCVAELGAVLGVSDDGGEAADGPRPRAAAPAAAAVVPGPGRAGARLAGQAGGGGHHPRHPDPDPRGGRVGRHPGRRRGREGRSRTARPAGGGGDQAVRAGRGGAVRPRRVAEGRPPPRHHRPRRGPLRRDPAPRGRDRHRRRPRPRPGPRPGRRDPQGTRVHPVARCPAGAGAR